MTSLNPPTSDSELQSFTPVTEFPAPEVPPAEGHEGAAGIHYSQEPETSADSSTGDGVENNPSQQGQGQFEKVATKPSETQTTHTEYQTPLSATITSGGAKPVGSRQTATQAQTVEQTESTPDVDPQIDHDLPRLSLTTTLPTTSEPYGGARPHTDLSLNPTTEDVIICDQIQPPQQCESFPTPADIQCLLEHADIRHKAANTRILCGDPSPAPVVFRLETTPEEARRHKVTAALQERPLNVGKLAHKMGEKKGRELNKLLYSMRDDGLLHKLQDSPPVWSLRSDQLQVMKDKIPPQRVLIQPTGVTVRQVHLSLRVLKSQQLQSYLDSDIRTEEPTSNVTITGNGSASKLGELLDPGGLKTRLFGSGPFDRFFKHHIKAPTAMWADRAPLNTGQLKPSKPRPTIPDHRKMSRFYDEVGREKTTAAGTPGASHQILLSLHLKGSSPYIRVINDVPEGLAGYLVGRGEGSTVNFYFVLASLHDVAIDGESLKSACPWAHGGQRFKKSAFYVRPFQDTIGVLAVAHAELERFWAVFSEYPYASITRISLEPVHAYAEKLPEQKGVYVPLEPHTPSVGDDAPSDVKPAEDSESSCPPGYGPTWFQPPAMQTFDFVCSVLKKGSKLNLEHYFPPSPPAPILLRELVLRKKNTFLQRTDGSLDETGGGQVVYFHTLSGLSEAFYRSSHASRYEPHNEINRQAWEDQNTNKVIIAVIPVPLGSTVREEVARVDVLETYHRVVLGKPLDTCLITDCHLRRGGAVRKATGEPRPLPSIIASAKCIHASATYDKLRTNPMEVASILEQGENAVLEASASGGLPTLRCLALRVARPAMLGNTTRDLFSPDGGGLPTDVPKAVNRRPDKTEMQLCLAKLTNLGSSFNGEQFARVVDSALHATRGLDPNDDRVHQQWAQPDSYKRIRFGTTCSSPHGDHRSHSYEDYLEYFTSQGQVVPITGGQHQVVPKHLCCLTRALNLTDYVKNEWFDRDRKHSGSHWRTKFYHTQLSFKAQKALYHSVCTKKTTWGVPGDPMHLNGLGVWRPQGSDTFFCKKQREAVRLLENMEACLALVGPYHDYHDYHEPGDSTTNSPEKALAEAAHLDVLHRCLAQDFGIVGTPRDFSWTQRPKLETQAMYGDPSHKQNYTLHAIQRRAWCGVGVSWSALAALCRVEQMNQLVFELDQLRLPNPVSQYEPGFRGFSLQQAVETAETMLWDNDHEGKMGRAVVHRLVDAAIIRSPFDGFGQRFNPQCCSSGQELKICRHRVSVENKAFRPDVLFAAGLSTNNPGEQISHLKAFAQFYSPQSIATSEVVLQELEAVSGLALPRVYSVNPEHAAAAHPDYRGCVHYPKWAVQQHHSPATRKLVLRLNLMSTICATRQTTVDFEQLRALANCGVSALTRIPEHEMEPLVDTIDSIDDDGSHGGSAELVTGRDLDHVGHRDHEDHYEDMYPSEDDMDEARDEMGSPEARSNFNFAVHRANCAEYFLNHGTVVMQPAISPPFAGGIIREMPKGGFAHNMVARGADGLSLPGWSLDQPYPLNQAFSPQQLVEELNKSWAPGKEPVLDPEGLIPDELGPRREVIKQRRRAEAGCPARVISRAHLVPFVPLHIMNDAITFTAGEPKNHIQLTTRIASRLEDWNIPHTLSRGVLDRLIESGLLIPTDPGELFGDLQLSQRMRDYHTANPHGLEPLGSPPTYRYLAAGLQTGPRDLADLGVLPFGDTQAGNTPPFTGSIRDGATVRFPVMVTEDGEVSVVPAVLIVTPRPLASRNYNSIRTERKGNPVTIHVDTQFSLREGEGEGGGNSTLLRDSSFEVSWSQKDHNGLYYKEPGADNNHWMAMASDHGALLVDGKTFFSVITDSEDVIRGPSFQAAAALLMRGASTASLVAAELSGTLATTSPMEKHILEEMRRGSSAWLEMVIPARIVLATATQATRDLIGTLGLSPQEVDEWAEGSIDNELDQTPVRGSTFLELLALVNRGASTQTQRLERMAVDFPAQSAESGIVQSYRGGGGSRPTRSAAEDDRFQRVKEQAAADYEAVLKGSKFYTLGDQEVFDESVLGAFLNEQGITYDLLYKMTDQGRITKELDDIVRTITVVRSNTDPASETPFAGPFSFETRIGSVGKQNKKENRTMAWSSDTGQAVARIQASLSQASNIKLTDGTSAATSIYQPTYPTDGSGDRSRPAGFSVKGRTALAQSLLVFSGVLAPSTAGPVSILTNQVAGNTRDQPVVFWVPHCQNKEEVLFGAHHAEDRPRSPPAFEGASVTEDQAADLCSRTPTVDFNYDVPQKYVVPIGLTGSDCFEPFCSPPAVSNVHHAALSGEVVLITDRVRDTLNRHSPRRFEPLATTTPDSDNPESIKGVSGARSEAEHTPAPEPANTLGGLPPQHQPDGKPSSAPAGHQSSPSSASIRTKTTNGFHEAGEGDDQHPATQTTGGGQENEAKATENDSLLDLDSLDPKPQPALRAVAEAVRKESTLPHRVNNLDPVPETEPATEQAAEQAARAKARGGGRQSPTGSEQEPIGDESPPALTTNQSPGTTVAPRGDG